MTDRAHSIERIYEDNVNRREALFDALRASGTDEQRRALVDNRVEDWPGKMRRAQEMLMLASAILALRVEVGTLRQAVALPDPDEERDAILRQLTDIAERHDQIRADVGQFQVLVPLALLRRARALVLSGKEGR